jgi:hypothetical protein|tara:strand:+ start:268 stop:423 length:156 start_codon:yes stop_codon:yes gene_type:complete
MHDHQACNGAWLMESIMNFLAMIKAKLEKAARLHDAQIAHLSYRGVPYAKA